MAWSLVGQAVLGAACFVVCVLFFRDKPKTPPSATAFALLDKPGEFRKSIAGVLGCRDMWFLSLAFGGIQGTFNTLGTVVGEATGEYGFDGDNASLFGALFIVGGVLGSAAFGVYVEATRKYKLSVVLICFCSFVFTLASYFAIPQRRTWLVSLLCFFQGASMVPIMAVGFDFGVEVTYPIGESFSTGVLMSAGQLFGIIFTVVSSELIDNRQQTGTDISYLIMTGACLMSTVFSLFVNQNLKRLEAERQQKMKVDVGF